MKLLLVTSRYPFGPKESFLTEEIAQLSRSFDVRVLPALPTAERLAVPALRDRAIRLRFLAPRAMRLAAIEFVRDPLRAARAFATVVGAPRALHAKVKNAAIFPTALAAAHIARKRGIDHVHAYWLTTPSTIAFVVSQLCGISWSATGHRYDLVDFNVRTEDPSRAGFFPSARFVRAISSQGAQRLAKAFPRGRPPLGVIHLGVALPSAETPLQTSTGLHLLCAANLEPVKGHEHLLQALAIASKGADVRCTIAGDGTLREHLEARASELGLRNAITFEGVVPHERLLERMSAGEFGGAVLTSVDDGPSQREGIPVFLMEAMARGLPAIATRSGAVTELADDSNALLCEPGNVAQLADAIVALATDQTLRLRLSTAGRARVATEFDAVSCAGELAAALRDEPRDSTVPIKGLEIPA